ncbi:MAG: folate-binding protein [Pseudomonadota bacterium]
MTRTILRLSGTDTDKFLDGLLTRNIPETGLGYAALLTPQGKYLADFLMFRADGAAHLDMATDLVPPTVQRLNMYKLRSDVTIEATDLQVQRGLDDAPEGAMTDPRPGMGWRRYGTAMPSDDADWDAVRVENLIPESGTELIPNESYILEMGFERLGGVDFKKGCYVGQEIVARMKHKTELRKGLARVGLDGPAQPGTEITSGGKPVGTLNTVSGDRALAYLRFDRAQTMQAGDTALTLDARI